MRRSSEISLMLLAVVLLWCRAALGQNEGENGPWVKPARQLHASMVTLRLSCPGKEEDAADASGASAGAKISQKPPAPASASDQPRDKKSVGASGKDCRRPCSVIVCSGVCVAANKVVTAVPVSSDSKIRLTFPGGTQDDARLRVIDEFSGLVLLESPNCAAQPLEMAADLPDEGSAVMTAAAWGVEKPLVFQGIVSGTGHMLSGVCYPPLLVCQLPTTNTSTGSAIVNRDGKLVAVVVGADPAELHRGWMTYAAPASHVQRLLRACETSEKEGRQDSVVVLKRRRPKVGWVLESEGELVKVARILADGPAETAGIQKGDLVLAAEGVQIRSIYQAHSHTMCKQAGDTLTYRIQRGDRALDVVVVLGGGVEVESLPAEKLNEIVQPKLEFGRDANGLYYVRPYRADSGAAKEAPPAESDEINKLREQVQRQQKLIDALLLERIKNDRSAPPEKSP